MAAKRNKTQDEWMSVGAAAKAAGESRLSMLTRAVKGEVVAQHIAGRTLIRRDSISALIKARRAVA